MTDITEPFAHVPARGWTPELKARFLDRLALYDMDLPFIAAAGSALACVEACEEDASCRAVDLSAEAAYRLRRRDAFFARGWAAALVLARENGVQALAERAIEGVEEQIYYRGELVGTRRRYDARLLLAHLARLDAMVGDNAACADAGRFDELLNCVATGELALPPVRKDAVAAAGEEARRNHREKELEVFYGAAEDDVQDDDDSGWTVSESSAEFLGGLDDECDEVAAQAREDAGHEWDRRLADTFDTVDALCGWPASPTAPGLPIRVRPPRVDPSALAQLMTLACQTVDRPASEPLASARPRTLSTVSTCAVSRMLVRSSSHRTAPHPRSPFGAPRTDARR